MRTFGRRHVYKRLFYSPEDYEHSLREAGFTIGRVQFFPLRLDMGKYLPHCQVIREMPEGDGSDSLAVKEFV